MTRAHKKFEVLCALAVVEPLSEKDLRELMSHCLCCDCCRRHLSEAEAISQECFLFFAARSEKTTALPSGAQDRFLRRASAIGIPLSQTSSKKPTSRLVQLPIGVFVATVVALFLCRSLIPFHALPRDPQSRDLSSTSNIPTPRNHVAAGAPASASINIPIKRRHTAERLTMRVNQVRYRPQFQFPPQLNLTHGIATSDEPLVLKLSSPVNWDTLRPIPGKTFALTSLPQLWPGDDPASHDKHIAHFDLPGLFPKSNDKTH